MADPFEGIGRALARLRKGAGFATQTQASEATKLEKSQLSRWENEKPRPTLENLGRLLDAYGATAQDFVLALEGVVTERAKAEDRGPSDEEMIRSLAEAIRRIEARQDEIESRIERLEQERGRRQDDGVAPSRTPPSPLLRGGIPPRVDTWRQEDAERALLSVRDGFLSQGIGYDAAMVSLDLALLYLKEGRTEDVGQLAEEMHPIFCAEDIHREALAALFLFQEAARRGAATVGLVEDLYAYLKRARKDPELRFIRQPEPGS